MAGKPRSAGKRKMWKRKAPRRNRRSTVNVNRALHPIPQRYITVQKYSDTFLLNTSQTVYNFNLNSVYDPNRTGIGHQPYGFDTLATMYNRYRVIGCSWAINGYNTGSAIRIGCLVGNDVALATTISDLVERPRARFITQLPGGSTQTLKGKVSIPSVVGRSKAQYMADDRYQALVTGDPAELAILQVACANMADILIDGTALTITLEYTVEYFDMKPLAQS